MPITHLTRDDATGLLPVYPIVSAYRTDDSRVPHYNPTDSGVDILPGEPILKLINGDQQVFIAQGPIKPGQTGYLVRRYTIEVPCDLSADVPEGTPIYWDKDIATDANPVGIASLAGDVTNGFQIGVATYPYDQSKVNDDNVDGDDLMICGDAESTHIWVMSVEGNTPGLGDYEFGAS